MSASNFSPALLSTLGLASILATRDDAPVKALQVKLSPLETRDNVPLVQQYGFSSRPKPGANAVVLFLKGDRSQGVTIATTDQRYVLHLSEGEAALHTDEGDHVYLKRGRKIDVLAGAEVDVTAPQVNIVASTQCHITGPTLVTGNMTVTGDVIGMQNIRAVQDVTDRNLAHGSLATLRDAYNAHTHTQPADSRGDTEAATDTTSNPVA